MIIVKPASAKDPRFLNDKVTLRRLGAPLLYAYDANTFSRRLKGLHGVPTLAPTDALIIRPCKAVHTFGMQYTIDVIFMDKKGVILKIATLPPGRMTLCLRGVVVVEMAHGTAKRLGLGVGHKFVPDGDAW